MSSIGRFLSTTPASRNLKRSNHKKHDGKPAQKVLQWPNCSVSFARRLCKSVVPCARVAEDEERPRMDGLRRDFPRIEQPLDGAEQRVEDGDEQDEQNALPIVFPVDVLAVAV